MDVEMKNASFEGKSKFELPKDAEVLNSSYSIRVEEIENGFIICKNYDIKYRIGDNVEYSYHCKKWFSKENPMSINLEDEEVPLEDKLD